MGAGFLPDMEVRVRVIALMGQVMGFRVGRAATLRLTGWARSWNETERALIDRVVQAGISGPSSINSRQEQRA